MTTEHDNEQQDERTPDALGPVPPSAAAPAPPFAPPALPASDAPVPPAPTAPPEDQAGPSATPQHPRQSRRVLAGSVAGALVVGALGGAGVTALVGGGQSAQAAGGSSVGTGLGGPGTGVAPGQGTDGSGESGSSDGGSVGEAPSDGTGGSDGTGQAPSGMPGGGGAASGGASGTASGTSTALEQTTATSSEAAGVVVVEAILDGGRAESAGTGIVLTSDGEVLTNAHVVEGASEVRVVDAATGKSYTATVTASSTTHDVAVLQLSGASGLTTATLDTDDDLTVGDDVTAVGNSGGTGVLRAADGTVAALDQTITTASEYGESGETLTGVIAVDADVVSGDSGGALLDSDGEVVGMTTAATSGTADVEGYAIDIEDALTVVHEILGEASTGVSDTSFVVLPGGELVTLGRHDES
ncbi:S1C family serine protease [Luteimicrobium sp. DT211]|uniref:S1C family serine protease n=1 Tax=Luteimicrobium sp. DT211 TaxID=3393412 RepID=UPI003CECC266